MATDKHIMDVLVDSAAGAVDKAVDLVGGGVGAAAEATKDVAWGTMCGAGAAVSAFAATVTDQALAAVDHDGITFEQEMVVEPAQEEINPFAQMLEGVDLGGMQQLDASFEAPTGLVEIDAQNVAFNPEFKREQQQGAMIG